MTDPPVIGFADTPLQVWPPRELVDLDANADVVRFVDRSTPSAHSDLAEAVMSAARSECPGALACSPSFVQLRYVMLVARRRVFALAFGMHELALRLDEQGRREAVPAGAAPAGEIGPEWVIFRLFYDLHPGPDLNRWIRRAFDTIPAE